MLHLRWLNGLECSRSVETRPAIMILNIPLVVCLVVLGIVISAATKPDTFHTQHSFSKVFLWIAVGDKLNSITANGERHEE